MAPKYNYFRLSKSVRNPLELRKYFLSIANLKIPCCVIKEISGWALWREGIEAMDTSNTNTKPNNVKMGNTACMLYDPENVFGLRKKV